MTEHTDTPVLFLVTLLLSIGAAGGFLSGLLGIGGGVIFVPALFFALGAAGVDAEHGMHVAVATSLCIVFATGVTSALAHYRRGAVDIGLCKAWAPFIVLGVAVGALFASSVNGAILKHVFAGITMLIAVYMAAGKERSEGGAARLSALMQRFLCFLTGIVASLIGVGGAILTVPMMSYSGVPMQRAVGTGAALGTVISLPGTIGYMLAGAMRPEGLPPYSLGYVNLLAAAIIIPASIALAPLGVRAAHAAPRLVLRRIFAGVLIVVSARMFMTL